jgi:hypothetical protein
MFFYLIFRRFRFVFASSSINCLTLVSFFASTRYQRKHSWKSEWFYNSFWLFEIASEMIEKMLTKSTKRRYKLMRRNCFSWKISRTRFALLSNERFLRCMIWIWILKRNNSFFVVMIDFTSIQWYLLLINWSIIFDSFLLRVRCVFARFVKILLMKIFDQIVNLNVIDIYSLIFSIWSTQSFDKIL